MSMFIRLSQSGPKLLVAIAVIGLSLVACAGASKKADPAVEEVDLMAGEESAVKLNTDKVDTPKDAPAEEGGDLPKVKKGTKAKAKNKKNTEALSPEIVQIKGVVKKYQETLAVGMKVEKKVHLALMDEEKTGRGELWYSKGRLKMAIEKPEDSLLVLNDDIIWVVVKLPEEFGGTVQVTKMKAAQLKKSNALLAVLFGDEAVWDRFEVLKVDQGKESLKVELKPAKGAQLADVAKVRVEIDNQDQKISAIAYWDELENETSYRFSEVRFGVKLSKGHFKYKPPAGAEVTEI
jgi:outer membrane lipoprotein-sorting protein